MNTTCFPFQRLLCDCVLLIGQFFFVLIDHQKKKMHIYSSIWSPDLFNPPAQINCLPDQIKPTSWEAIWVIMFESID